LRVIVISFRNGQVNYSTQNIKASYPFMLHNALLFQNNIPSATQIPLLALRVIVISFRNTQGNFFIQNIKASYPFTLHHALLLRNNVPSAPQPSPPTSQVFADCQRNGQLFLAKL